MSDTLTTKDDIEKVWRPLRASESARVDGLIGLVERALSRDYPIDRFVEEGKLTREDVADVVSFLVLPILAPDVDLPLAARSWQDTSGSESRSVTLTTSTGNQMLVLAPWMVKMLDKAAGEPAPSSGIAGPVGGGFGDRGSFAGLFDSDQVRGLASWRSTQTN